MLPMPDEAMDTGSLPLLLAATRSVAEVAGCDALTTSSSTLLTTSETGVKSRSMR